MLNDEVAAVGSDFVGGKYNTGNVVIFDKVAAVGSDFIGGKYNTGNVVIFDNIYLQCENLKMIFRAVAAMLV